MNVLLKKNVQHNINYNVIYIVSAIILGTNIYIFITLPVKFVLHVSLNYFTLIFKSRFLRKQITENYLNYNSKFFIVLVNTF